MRVRTRWSGLLLLVAGLTVSSMLISGLPASAQDQHTVSFSYWGDPAEQRAYERVIEEFEALNPDIEIDARYVADQGDYQTKIATGFAAGAEPDLFLINYRRFGQYAARGALEPLGPYLEASESLAKEDFYQMPLDAFSYRAGELTCMPQNVSSLVVYLNLDLFAQYGVEVPYDGWTWDEFVVAAETLTRDDNGDGVFEVRGLAVDPTMVRYAPFIWGAGGEIVDDVDNPTTLTLDTPEALEGINWFISLGQTGSAVAPNEAEAVSQDDESRFMSGGAAMLMQSRRVVPTLREIESFKWDAVALPVGKQAANILHSDAFCMSAGADNKDAAWRFVEFATGEAGQTIMAETGRTVPSMISVAESDAFLKGTTLGAQIGSDSLALSPANSQVFLDNIEILHRFPSISTWPEVEDAFNVPFKRAFYVEIDVEGAIEVATYTSRDAFQRAYEEEQLTSGS